MLNVLWLICVARAVASGLSEDGRRETADGAEPPTDDRITAEFPFLVGVTARGKFAENSSTALCTGTLVSPVFVLSSAYCVSRLTNKVKVRGDHVVPRRYSHPTTPGGRDWALGPLRHPYAEICRRHFTSELLWWSIHSAFLFVKFKRSLPDFYGEIHGGGRGRRVQSSPHLERVFLVLFCLYNACFSFIGTIVIHRLN